MCKINPKVDFAFKKLFGSEENKDILMAFINSMLSKDEQVKSIVLKNPYNLTDYLGGKMSILDIKAVDDKDVWYDIEIQIAEQSYYDKRAMYYWGKVYTDQITSGYDYDLLKKTISINILDFDYLDEIDYHNVYEVMNQKSKRRLTDIFQMHFVELNKFDKNYTDIKTALDRWTIFLNKAYEIEKDKIPKELAEDENVKKAIEKLDLMYLNAEERRAYETVLKQEMVHRAEIKTARTDEKITIAKNLLKIGMSISDISSATNLNHEEIEKLKN